MDRHRTLGAVLVALTLVLSACSKKVVNDLTDQKVQTDPFPDGKEGEALVEFTDTSRGYINSGVTALNNVPNYPVHMGIPHSLNLGSGFGLPGSTPLSDVPFVPGTFSPPSQPLLIMDGYPHLDFGAVQVGANSERTLRIANVGGSALLLLALQMNVPSGEYQHVGNDCPAILPPMYQCSIRLRFSPKEDGTRAQITRIVYMRPNRSLAATYREIRGVGLDNPHKVGLGRFHACATYEGRAYCWGLGNKGQLGNGATDQSQVPVEVYGVGEHASDITAGYKFSCAVVNGAAKCWGHNGTGQLGNGTYSNSAYPVTVAGLESGVTQISAFHEHACAVQNGAAKCWGHNSHGELGDGSTTKRNIPVTVSGLASGVKQVTVGKHHSCALLNSGEVRCWGYNTYGQLGTGNTSSKHTPVSVVNLSSGVIQVDAGTLQTCAIREGGELLCWGYNGYGELGDGSTSPRYIPSAVAGMWSGVTHVATGEYHTCAIQNDQAKCWGWNGAGAVGTGSVSAREKNPVIVSGTDGITHLDVHYGFTCGVIAGRTHCWGKGEYGKLGNNSSSNRHLPLAVYSGYGFQ